MKDQRNIEELFKKYTEGTATANEAEELIKFIQTRNNANKINELIEQTFLIEATADQLKNLDSLKRIYETKSSLLQKISLKEPTVSIRKTINWTYLGAAAAIILIASLIFIYNGNKTQPKENTVVITDLPPGTNKAILTLSDGKKISLSDAQNGQLVNQAEVSITKTSEGQIIYSAAQSTKKANSYNTIETPNGGEYCVTLPDGTKVWLNAASSLKYPISFSALKDRMVELTGEAYFEVAHNKAKPFRVVTNGQTVEVLGTHFNINSYADEKKTTTTLAEGSVKVFSSSQTKIIKPGQQTLLNQNGNIVVQEANLETALAWKNGKIYFKDADIKTIMRQVSRWYNIEVEYQGEIPERAFNGGVARKSNLSSLLKILELNNIHFTIEYNGVNKKLIVKP